MLLVTNTDDTMLLSNKIMFSLILEIMQYQILIDVILTKLPLSDLSFDVWQSVLEGVKFHGALLGADGQDPVDSNGNTILQ